MTRCVRFGFVVTVLLAAAPVFVAAQSKAKAENVPEIPYDSVPNFLKLPPNLYLGEGIGVATNSKEHVFVYTRSGDTRLFEFDQNGTFVREIGQGLYGFEFAHAVRVDPQDNIWASGATRVRPQHWFRNSASLSSYCGDAPTAADTDVMSRPIPPVGVCGLIRKRN